MKTKQRELLKTTSVAVIGMAGSMLIRKLIFKARPKKNKAKAPKVHESSLPEAITWTLMASVIGGIAKLFLKRYTEAGIAKIEQ